MSPTQPKAIRCCRRFNGWVLIALALLLLVIPGLTTCRDLMDPAIRTGGIPRAAWRLHHSLTPRYELWAKKRLASARAAELSTANISGTEWPLFGSVFYLWATESLQDEWEHDHSRSPTAPAVYAKGAIHAATQLVMDPTQASWVKVHWGTNYLKTQNVFYRMLVISALTSHARLTGDKQYLPLLRDQVESLSTELDDSAHGILDDYPGQCYPGDVLTAIAMIRRADRVLGTDHSAFVSRAIRGFEGKALDHGLVAYSASAGSGLPEDVSRGCGNSYILLTAPEIWPDQARQWYELYTKSYWQTAWTCAGFREFPSDIPGHEWYIDVDSGPVLKGYGCSACAFGVGAARVNGHFEHAYPLTAELLATSFPFIDGSLILPRMLSDATDAPYLGEAGILFNLTRMPASGFPVTTGGSLPWFVVIVLSLQLGFGALLLVASLRGLRRIRREGDDIVVPFASVQLGVWLALLAAAAVLFISGKTLPGLAALLLLQFLPRVHRAAKPASAPPAPAG